MFIEIGLKDIIDILLVALMLYYIYRLMRESRSLNVFIGIMMFVVVWIFVSQVLEMRLLGTILDKLVSVGVIALIVLFQDDIRKVLYNLGAHQRMRRLSAFFTSKKTRERKKGSVKQDIMPVVMACMNMSRNKVGALIVFERSMPLDEAVSTGDRINADINQRLIENIFFKNSPLHDGAMIISDQGGKLYPACEPRPGHPEGAGTAPPLGHGYCSGERRTGHCGKRGDGHHLNSHTRRIPPPPVGRGTGKHSHQGA